ncbi:hypothetical protein FQN60_007106, partial [Etheostoma spectabile]
RIELIYHFEDHRFASLKRSFIKPQEGQVDPSEKPLITYLKDMLVDLMRDEEKVVRQIEASKQEVRDILAYREQEEKDVQLKFSTQTTTGAAMARRQRQEMEHLPPTSSRNTMKRC